MACCQTGPIQGYVIENNTGCQPFGRGAILPLDPIRQVPRMFDLIAILESKTSLMTVPEVSELFRVSRSTVQRLVDDRILPSFLIGGQRRFDPAQLARWVSKRNPGIMDGRLKMPER